ncbi:bifunctional diguanylate cyclase/phosphodiesterase [Methyloversatilis sp.]|uniref:putative bifunctional diguanylate cyclase/phosphodiesterase n=1 Tax=Methyloversatilis sp. TaxID=2569862 RepID=UPI0027338AC4|nr:EAL domain-containing protein [Methyloversatilis sp.]MDP2870267.1 EAL domain-containing protein [Methyloversatilis sp.]MDP3456539.1 EAL domain-containing protein [Methyloversatilis sp.]MDP3579229.1 EAL domain-containing protein [Methyloversatilis sp.]
MGMPRVMRAAREFFRAYDVDEATAARFRARQIEALLRYTPMAMVINVINAAIVCMATWSAASHVFLVTWAAVISAIAAFGLHGWLKSQSRPARQSASRRAIRHVVAQASALSLAWAMMPIALYGVPDPNLRLFVAMVTCGMLGAGAFALSSVPFAATAYVLILGAGAAIAVAVENHSHAGGLALMLLIYCVMVIFSSWAAARTLGARLTAEARADRQNEVIGLLLRDFENHASDLLWELDANWRFVHVSPRLETALSTLADDLRSTHAAITLKPMASVSNDMRAAWRVVYRTFARGAPFRDLLLPLSNASGYRCWSLSARPLLDDHGQLTGWRGVAADVTENQTINRRLAWLAHNDALTGLVNRNQFHDELAAHLASHPTAMQPLAVICLDLDGFKDVNDTLGHASGDLFLQAFAQRLLFYTRRSDTVARLGGDEFAILLRGVAGADTVRMQLDRLLEGLKTPCDIHEQRLTVRTSIGVALAPHDGTDVDVLLKRADLALYAAKHGGGSRYCFFDGSMAELAQRRSDIQSALQGAVQRGEMRLVFQPQVSLDTWVVSGFEALLRWHHPERGDVSPAEFIPIAEACGLMPVIGEWVLTEACRQAAGWPSGLRVSINVSAVQLGLSHFIDQVRTATAGLEPHRVELEITESVLMDNTEEAVATLNILRSEGFLIALDDFGTGYSALSYIRRFPFDTLKIDRSFVRDLASDSEAQVLVDTILAMSRALKMTAVAEGVENVDEARLLRSRGCALMQGFLVSRPVEGAEVLRFMSSWNPEAVAARMDRA